MNYAIFGRQALLNAGAWSFVMHREQKGQWPMGWSIHSENKGL